MCLKSMTALFPLHIIISHVTKDSTYSIERYYKPLIGRLPKEVTRFNLPQIAKSYFWSLVAYDSGFFSHSLLHISTNISYSCAKVLVLRTDLFENSIYFVAACEPIGGGVIFFLFPNRQVSRIPPYKLAPRALKIMSIILNRETH